VHIYIFLASIMGYLWGHFATIFSLKQGLIGKENYLGKKP